ncbi:MAG: DUF2911 domain-containing protein [Gemmatimonadota bacterium]
MARPTPCALIRSALTLAFLATATGPVLAQEATGPRPSQHGTVSQTVNETTITLEYDRPVARGRELFGGIVDWDAVWTPGANRATWLEVSTDVTFAGQALAAGRYGIWLTPKETGPWEVVLVRDWDTHHSFFPYESEALRTGVGPTTGSHMEVLAFYFPVVGPYETTLNLHWGTTVLPLRIEVPR